MNDMSNNCIVDNTTLRHNFIDNLILDMIEQPIKKHSTTKVKQTRGDDSRGTYGYVGNYNLYTK